MGILLESMGNICDCARRTIMKDEGKNKGHGIVKIFNGVGWGKG